MDFKGIKTHPRTGNGQTSMSISDMFRNIGMSPNLLVNADFQQKKWKRRAEKP